MPRLTRREPDGSAIPVSSGPRWIQDIVERLAEYEDSGFEPDELGQQSPTLRWVSLGDEEPAVETQLFTHTLLLTDGVYTDIGVGILDGCEFKFICCSGRVDRPTHWAYIPPLPREKPDDEKEVEK